MAAARKVAAARKRVAVYRSAGSRGGTCPPAGPAPRWLLYGAAALLVVLVVVLVWRWAVVARQGAAYSAQQQRLAASRQEGFYSADGAKAPSPSPSPSKAPSYEIVFLYMNGCGWCDKFKPQWEEFKSKYADELRSLSVLPVSYERSDSAAARYGATAFPTIVLARGDSHAVVSKFGGDRTPEGLIEFVRTNVAGREGFFWFHEDDGPAGVGGVMSAALSRARAGAEANKDSKLLEAQTASSIPRPSS